MSIMAVEMRKLWCLAGLLMYQVAVATSQCVKINNCSCRSSQGVIDLSGISGNPPFQDQMDDGGTWMYSYSPCTPFTEGDGECSNVAVCQVSADMSETYPCGTVDSASFGADDAGNVQVTYSSTDSAGTSRTTVVTLRCDLSGGGDTLEVTGEDPSTQGTYLMTLTSPHCCPIQNHTTPSTTTTPIPTPTPSPSPKPPVPGWISIGSFTCLMSGGTNVPGTPPVGTNFQATAAEILQAMEGNGRPQSGADINPYLSYGLTIAQRLQELETRERKSYKRMAILRSEIDKLITACILEK